MGDSQIFECLVLKFAFEDISQRSDIDEIPGKIISSIIEHGGILEYFDCEHVYAFFQSGYENAMKCALSVINELRKSHKLDIHASMSSGEALATVIGGSIRSEGIIISKHKDIADKLNLLAQKFNCSLLASEFACTGISVGSKEFSKRFIGKMTVAGVKAPVSVYEIIDCRLQEAMKKKTIKQFETGLRLFYDMKFEMAEKYFVDVIREHNNDLAAKYYYDKCEARGDEQIIREIAE